MYKMKFIPDFSNIFSEYYEFTDIFSKSKAKFLTSYYSYNFKINLEEDIQSLVGTIYSSLAFEQEALKKFIKKNLNTRYIKLTFFLHSVLVLFVKNKNKSLYCCINFHRLNYITKKDCYLLSLISNLLNLSDKAYIYTKLNLYYAYYLVYISECNE